MKSAISIHRLLIFSFEKGTQDRFLRGIPPLLVLALLCVFLLFAGPQSLVAAQSTSVETSISCEHLVEDSQQKLRCTLTATGADDLTLEGIYWQPYSSFLDNSPATTELEYTWNVPVELCRQSTTIDADSTFRSADNTATNSSAGTSVTFPACLPILITVDSDCSLANAIRSANGEDQIAETGDADGNDDCEAGNVPYDGADPPQFGEDIIRLSANITLSAALPPITSQVQIDGNNRTLNGDETYSGFMINGGVASISDITITKAVSMSSGGALYVSEGELSLSDSIITTNKAGDIGGGLYASDSDVTISNTRFHQNMTEKSHGGGVYFVSTEGTNSLSIDGSVFQQNNATEDGGGLKIAGGTITITKSTFSYNTSDEGGAIEASNATLTIENSTFSNNSAREGGGLSSFGSDVTLTHTTWAENSADEQGGGIAIIGWLGSFKIRNTLITGSTSGGDCHPGPNPEIIVEFTGNFIQDGTCTPPPAEEEEDAESQATVDGEEPEAEAQAAVGGDDVEAQVELEAQAEAETGDDELQAQHLPDEGEHVPMGNPMLRSLQGILPHHPLSWGSPAIDGGDPAYCLTDDQINTERPQFDNCDIGAYEYPKAPDPPPDPPEDDDDPDPDPDPSPTPDPPTNDCPVNERINVQSDNDDIQCELVDILDLDKHPGLEGGRFAVRIWRSSAECIHRVADGENLYRLAIRYETTMDVLRAHNGLGSDILSVGQELLLPSCAPDVLEFQNTQICFENEGNLVFIDTSKSPPAVYSLETFSVNGQTCAVISSPGTVVLTALES